MRVSIQMTSQSELRDLLLNSNAVTMQISGHMPILTPKKSEFRWGITLKKIREGWIVLTFWHDPGHSTETSCMPTTPGLQQHNWASVRGGQCSLLLLQFPLLLPAPFNFLPFAPFSLFPCSFFIFLCSLLLFNFSSCSMFLFQTFHCFMLLLIIFGAPCSRITLVCSLLLYLFDGLLLCAK